MHRFLKWIGLLTGLFVVGAGGYLFLAIRHCEKVFNPDSGKNRARDKV